MTRIHPDKLRVILREQLYRTVAIQASMGGGWYMPRPRFHVTNSTLRNVVA